MKAFPEGANEYMIHREGILKEFQRSGEFFISPDFVAAQGLIIFPGKARELSVVTNAVDEDLIRYRIVHHAVRSRGAQAGLNFRIKKKDTFNHNQQLLL